MLTRNAHLHLNDVHAQHIQAHAYQLVLTQKDAHIVAKIQGKKLWRSNHVYTGLLSVKKIPTYSLIHLPSVMPADGTQVF